MDGARIIQAVASLNVAPKEITWKVGVDVLCCGGTKAGISGTDAVVFFNKDLAREFEYRCKQAGQLASKMRFHAAAWVGLLENNAWLTYAKHSNACATYLANGLVMLGLKLANPVHANGVFVHIPPALGKKLKEMGWIYYDFIGGAARLMCSWRTTHLEIDAFLADVQKAMKSLNVD
jgi:threonine aldolase